MTLDVSIFLGTLCLVTADCFEVVCLKRSHFNQKNINTFFFFGWASVQLPRGFPLLFL